MMDRCDCFHSKGDRRQTLWTLWVVPWYFPFHLKHSNRPIVVVVVVAGRTWVPTRAIHDLDHPVPSPRTGVSSGLRRRLLRHYYHVPYSVWKHNVVRLDNNIDTGPPFP